MSGRLTLLTINLWGDHGPVTRRMADLADHLTRERPDVVAMQEVAGRPGRTRAHEVADATGYDVISAVRTGALGPRSEGLAVLSRLEGHHIDLIGLPGRIADLARGLQIVDVVTQAGAVVRIGNTHLTWRLDDTDLRVEQADAVAGALVGWTGPVVLAGDLNDTPGSLPLRRLAAAGFTDAYAASGAEERWTFHPDNPFVEQPELVRRRVDHVLVRRLGALAARVVLDGEDGPRVSDHHGVRVELTVEADPTEDPGG